VAAGVTRVLGDLQVDLWLELSLEKTACRRRWTRCGGHGGAFLGHESWCKRYRWLERDKDKDLAGRWNPGASLIGNGDVALASVLSAAQRKRKTILLSFFFYRNGKWLGRLQFGLDYCWADRPNWLVPMFFMSHFLFLFLFPVLRFPFEFEFCSGWI
jgi:hypothetical protein